MGATRTTRRFLALGCAAPLLLWAAVASAQQTYPEPPPPSGYSQPPPGYNGYGQPPPVERPEFERRGWFAGLELGVGSFAADGRFEVAEDRGAGLFGAHFGGMLTPRLGLMVLFSGAGQDLSNRNDYSSDATLSQINLGIALQYWASPKLWLKAGLVSSHLSLDEYGETVDEADGGGILAAIGYELYQSGRFILDAQLRMVNADHQEDGYLVSTTDSFGILLGANWY